MSNIKTDPATLQTASGTPGIKLMNDSFLFTEQETHHLRELAKCVAEIAALPVQAERAVLWQKHNDLEPTRPLVFIDPENGWNECIPADTLQCTTPMARVWEMFLRKQIYWFRVLRDDKVIEPYFDVPYSFGDTGWGLPLTRRQGAGRGSFIQVPAIEDYDSDFHKLRYPDLIIDEVESEQALTLAHTVFDGILTVRQKTIWWWSLGMTRDFINIRGLENFLCDLIAEPDNVHRLMNFLCEGHLKRLDFLQEKGYLSSNAGGTYCGSGGFGFTKQLREPGAGLEPVTTMDMWGLVESQETTAVSPEMYAEFVFPYHKRIAERFGLNYYGCCEPFDPRWSTIRKLPRLRRVSVSPWANWQKLPELLGKDYVASVKPSPTPLAQSVMDEDAARRDIQNALAHRDHCLLEIVMKDNHTLGNNPRNAARWVELVRAELG